MSSAAGPPCQTLNEVTCTPAVHGCVVIPLQRQTEGKEGGFYNQRGAETSFFFLFEEVVQKRDDIHSALMCLDKQLPWFK